MSRKATPSMHVLSAALVVLCMVSCDGRALSVANKVNYLYVWTGDTAAGAKDYIATVDVSPKSAKYGKVIKKTKIPYGGTEAHHLNVVRGGTALAAGALLEFVFKVPSMYFFDITNPASPKYIGSANSSAGAADDVMPIPGGFLVTQMGSATGGTPGKISRYNDNLQLVSEFGPNDTSFNPHGMSVSTKYKKFVTADFFEPRTAALEFNGNLAYRTTVRLWDLGTFELLKTFDHGSAAIMDARFLGDRPYAVFGNGPGEFFVLDVRTLEFRKVFTAPVEFTSPLAGMYRVYKKGTRLVATAWGSSVLLLIGFDDPWNPVLLDSYQLPAAANPHALELSNDKHGILLAVASYFVARPEILTVDLHGDRTVRWFTIKKDKIMPHPELKTIKFGGFGGNPHGLTFLVPVAK